MRKIFSIIALCFALSAASFAQTPADSLLEAARALCRDYRFDDALEMLVGIDDSTAVAGAEEVALVAANGSRLSLVVSEPAVVAKERFALSDFMLYYPLPDGAWRQSPNCLDSLGTCSSAVFYPEGAKEIYFSAPADSLGFYGIKTTAFADTIWTSPTVIGDELMVSSNEIYPMLSRDGKRMYFASDGLYGVGGYDLYCSEWDEENGEWGLPVNMGFPYSSPFDDFLLMDTPDGKYTVFASNRDCPADSVYVYVLEYEMLPVKKNGGSPENISRLCALEPISDVKKFDNGNAADGGLTESEDIKLYVSKIREVKGLKNAIAECESSLRSDRSLFAEIDDDSRREELSLKILSKESKLPLLQDSLRVATVSLQKIEMDFLFKGVVLDPDKLLAKADREVVNTSSAYTFTKMGFGKTPKMEFLVPEEPVVREEPLPEPPAAEPVRPVVPSKPQPLPDVLYSVNVTPVDEEENARNAISIIRGFCDKDMMRSREDSVTVYIVAPFTDKAEAEELEALVNESSSATAKVVEIPQNTAEPEEETAD